MRKLLRQGESTNQAVLYTLLVPVQNGTSKDILEWVQDHVLRRFGGLTTLAQSQGWWIGPSGTVYADDVWPIQCVVARTTDAEDWFRSLAAEIAANAGCQEGFVLKQPVTRLRGSSE